MYSVHGTVLHVVFSLLSSMRTNRDYKYKSLQQRQIVDSFEVGCTHSGEAKEDKENRLTLGFAWKKPLKGFSHLCVLLFRNAGRPPGSVPRSQHPVHHGADRDPPPSRPPLPGLYPRQGRHERHVQDAQPAGQRGVTGAEWVQQPGQQRPAALMSACVAVCVRVYWTSGDWKDKDQDIAVEHAFIDIMNVSENKNW